MLILCVGGGVFLVNNLRRRRPQESADHERQPTSTQAPGETETVDCDGLKGRTIAAVRNHLEKTDGFTVKVVDVASNQPAGTVVDIQPCGEAPKGSEVDGLGEHRSGRRGNGAARAVGRTPRCGGFPFGQPLPVDQRAARCCL